jgi:hypothetical protein
MIIFSTLKPKVVLLFFISTYLEDKLQFEEKP